MILFAMHIIVAKAYHDAALLMHPFGYPVLSKLSIQASTIIPAGSVQVNNTRLCTLMI